MCLLAKKVFVVTSDNFVLQNLKLLIEMRNEWDSVLLLIKICIFFVFSPFPHGKGSTHPSSLVNV